MNSKEKRQLENKISARNFRVRRFLCFSKTSCIILTFTLTECISSLEANIASRDSIIFAIRSELGSSKSENIALCQEIAAFKKTLLLQWSLFSRLALSPRTEEEARGSQYAERLAYFAEDWCESFLGWCELRHGAYW